jgi:hypothetical protein
MRYRLALFEKSAELTETLFFALRKSLCLSASEFGIFSEKESVRKVVDSLSTSKPFRELFRFLFGGTKRKERSRSSFYFQTTTKI